MSKYRESMERIYTGGIFAPGSWKEQSDRIFGPQEALKVWDMLMNLNFVPQWHRDLLFLSPSADIATHELAIFEHEAANRLGSSIFLVGDIRSIDFPNEQRIILNTNRESSHRFSYLCLDTQTPPIKPESVDVIWDRKGALWHTIYENEDPQMISDLFEEYHRILKPNGCLVVDAIQEAAILRGFRPLEKKLLEKYSKWVDKYGGSKITPLHIYDKESLQFEESTDLLLQSTKKFHPQIWENINSLFSNFRLGTGKYAIRVFVK